MQNSVAPTGVRCLLQAQPGVDKLFSRCPTFGPRDLTCTPDRARKKVDTQNQRHVLDTTTNAVFCLLLHKYHLQLSFSMHFYQNFMQ